MIPFLENALDAPAERGKKTRKEKRAYRKVTRPNRLVTLIKFITITTVGGLLLAGLVGLPTVAIPAAAVKKLGVSFQNIPASVLNPPLPGRTTLVTRDGAVIAEVFAINRVPVSSEQISPLMKKAVVATEDARFYEHSGVDTRGLARALVSTVSGSQVQGGSTITQQYIKNALVTQAVMDAGGEPDPAAVEAATGRSLMRKIKEMRLAVEVEKTATKDEILTRYLNISYFGYGAYGIQAAAQRYFSTDASNLSLSQVALLAGLLQSPSAYNPVTSETKALERRDQVLSRMAQEGDITASEAQAATQTPIALNMSAPKQGCATAKPGWGFICDQAIRELRTADWWDAKTERTHKLGAGGLKIVVTADPKVQNAAIAATVRAVPKTHRVANAQAVVVPGTGEVSALASNRAFGTGKGATELSLPTIPAFMPGSTFKLFTLTAALEKGIDVNTVLPAGYSYTSPKFNNPPGGYHNAEGANADNVTIRTATEMSLNTAYIQLLEKVGVNAVNDTAHRYGLTSIPAPGAPGAPGVKDGSFALGVKDVSVLQMAGAYATVAARGMYCVPHVVATVTSADGSVKEAPNTCTQAVATPVSDTVGSVLKSVVQEGTGRPSQLPGGRPSGGKTGTAEDLGAAWFAGYTPQYASVVWTGDPRSPNYTLHNVLGLAKVYGSTLPAQVWKETMTAAHVGLPIRNLPGVDPSYLLGIGAPKISKTVVIDVIGLRLDQAKARLAASGVTVNDVVETPAAWPAEPGQVVAMSVAPGSVVATGSTLTLTVAK